MCLWNYVSHHWRVYFVPINHHNYYLNEIVSVLQGSPSQTVSKRGLRIISILDSKLLLRRQVQDIISWLNASVAEPLLSNGSFTLADPDSDPYSESDSCTIQILRERDPDLNQCEKFWIILYSHRVWSLNPSLSPDPAMWISQNRFLIPQRFTCFIQPPSNLFASLNRKSIHFQHYKLPM